MGTFADSFRHIKDRKSFYETLERAVTASEAYPDDPGFARAAMQMKAIKDWTKGDKKPSRKNYESLDILRVIAMEYEPFRAEVKEVDDWAQLVGEVVIYVKHWLGDDEFSEVDKFDLPWY
jgi:hypothetical protein